MLLQCLLLFVLLEIKFTTQYIYAYAYAYVQVHVYIYAYVYVYVYVYVYQESGIRNPLFSTTTTGIHLML